LAHQSFEFSRSATRRAISADASSGIGKAELLDLAEHVSVGPNRRRARQA